MDEDNLRMAFKWIRDEIGAQLFPEKVLTYQRRSKGKITMVSNKGRTDDDERVTWGYAQEKGTKLSIRIEVC